MLTLAKGIIAINEPKGLTTVNNILQNAEDTATHTDKNDGLVLCRFRENEMQNPLRNLDSVQNFLEAG